MTLSPYSPSAGSLDQAAVAKKAEACFLAWDKVRMVLARELSDQSFKTWFDPVRCLDLDAASMILGVPDSYYGQWLKDHYQDLLLSALKEALGESREIKFAVFSPESQKISSSPTQKPKSSVAKTPPENHFQLNTKYTFDDFVIGPGNRFAHAAAMAVSEAPAKNYNPLFIHGPVGLGKTHLMQSIAHAIKKRFPTHKILYISSEKFTNQLITAIQTRTTSQFRNQYRTLDLLLIDDIHFIAEKEATQEEFFHTFNALYDAHKQIVVSSDRHPRDIAGLEERLVSRFGWGLVTDIQPPDFETRVAILKKKMEKETVSVSDDVCYFIASKFKSNVRELEGAMIRVVAYCTLTGHEPNLSVAESILKDSLKEEEGKISIEKIQQCVANYFKIKISDLRSKRRTQSVVEPRQIAMFLIRTLTTHSLPEIGTYFGGRDHTTVLHACNKVAKDLEKEDAKKRMIIELKEMLKR